MADPRKDDDVPHKTPQPVPPMPVGLPTGDADHPHTSPLHSDDDTEKPDPGKTPEPGNDINP